MKNSKFLKYAKLYGKICEVHGTQKAFADAIGCSEVTVSAKLQAKSQFSRNDIIIWSNALGITADEVGAYFFTNELSKS